MTLSPRHRTGRGLIALLLAILCLQAMPARPLQPMLERGPVFSAATYEVTLPPQREGVVRLQALAVRPGGFLPIVEHDGAHVAMPADPWPAHRATGPPLTPPPRSIASPREPPLPA